MQGVHAKEFEGLEIADQPQRDPDNGRADIGQELGDTGQQGQPDGIAHTEHRKHKKVEDECQTENDHLTTQEGIPDALEFFAQTLEVFRVAGDFDPEQVPAQAAAFGHDEIGHDQDKGAPAEEAGSTAGYCSQHLASASKHRLDIGKQLLTDLVQVDGAQVYRDGRSLVEPESQPH